MALRRRPVAQDAAGVAAHPWWALAVLCISLVVVTIQTSILNVALPSLVRDIGADDAELQWIVDSYIVAFAGVLLTGAAVADRFGRRGVMMAGLVLCGLASVAAALSQNPGPLIVWRTVMGIGAALVMPATLSILVNVFTEPAQRTRAIAYWTLMNATGAFIGPIAGGLLLGWTSWQSCFYVTLPLIVVAVVLGYVVVPTSRDPAAARFDVAGGVLSTAALGALIWGIIEGPSRGWTDGVVLGVFAAAVALGAAFVAWERRTPAPMLDLTIFANRQLRGATVALTVAFLAMTGAMYLAGLALQLGKGYTPLAAAVAISVPVTVVNFLVVPRTPWLIERFGIRAMVSGGIALIACAALVISTMTVNSGYLVLCLGFALMALAFSSFVPASTEAVVTSVPAERSGGASAVNQLTRQVGQALGVALGGALTAVGYTASFTAPDRGVSPVAAEAAGTSLTDALAVGAGLPAQARAALELAAHEAYVSGIRLSLWVAAGIALCGAAYAAATIPGRRTAPAEVHHVEQDPRSVDPTGTAFETT
ncbi:MFS transporter [Blastococcus sp. CT_GayMR16]|nr:MFS transporter [Blastococcus sp. CT_GayMR16]